MRTASSLLLLLLVGCLEAEAPPFPQPNDDDSASPDDDDSVTVDDDDASDDDDAVSVPTTFVEILNPAEGAVRGGSIDIEVAADGDAPGQLRLWLDDEEVTTTLFNAATGRALHSLDTLVYPDGEYELRAELVQQGLDHSVSFEMLNGDLLIYELGTLTLDSTNYPDVEVTVPSVGVSMQVQVDFAPTAATTYAGGIVRDAGGIYNIGGVPVPQYPTGPSALPPWAGGAPNHPDRSWPPGTYSIWPVANPEMDGTPADVRVVIKRALEELDGGILDLDLYFSPGSGLSAASAPTLPGFGNFVAHIDSILQQADIQLGVLRYYDLADSAFDVLDDYGEFGAMLAAGNPGTDRTLDMFFVDDVDLNAGPNVNVLGVAAHRPGVALRHATSQSGVAVESGRILDGREVQAAHTAAHELGHFLGLMHTSEVGGQDHDNLVDTPVACDASGCWATNLMDPLLAPGGADHTISADQRFVLLRHPLVRPLPAGARSWAPAPGASGPLSPGTTPVFCGTP